MTAEHTRDELVHMARQFGISAGDRKKSPAKMDIAKAIVKFSHKPESKGSSFKEAPSKGVAREFEAKRVGKHGVMAKRAAIDMQAKENEKAVDMFNEDVTGMVSDINKCVNKMFDGVHVMWKDVGVMRNSFKDKARENERAVTAFNARVGALRSDMKKKSGDISSGVRMIHKGVAEMARGNEEEARKIQRGVKEMNSGIRDMRCSMDDKTHDMMRDVRGFQDSIIDFQADVANYVKNFYYG